MGGDDAEGFLLWVPLKSNIEQDILNTEVGKDEQK